MEPPKATGAQPNRLGICAWCRIAAGFPERMPLFRDAGFEAISIWWEERFDHARRLRHVAPEIARRAGLIPESIHVPYTWADDLWSDEPARRREAVALHRSWVRDCARHEVPILVMHAATAPSLPVSFRGVDSLWRIMDTAHSCGVTVALENTRCLKHLDMLLDTIPSERLGLCYDVSHDRLFASPRGKLLGRWSHRIVTTHWNDTDGRRDQHWLPGEGVVDHDGVAADLGLAVYRGAIMVESVPRDPTVRAFVFLRRAFEAATFILKRVHATRADAGSRPEARGESKKRDDLFRRGFPLGLCRD
jgi:sugar phosphate isomerase/epimerase